MCQCYFLFNGSIRDQLSQNVLDRSSPNFQDRYIIWVGMINSTFFSRSFKGLCYDNRCLARIGENWHTPPSFCALAFHNPDGRVNTADDPSTQLNSTIFNGRTC